MKQEDTSQNVFRTKIMERIAELEKELQQFVTNANQQVAAYNAGIAELRRLLEPSTE